MDDCVEKLSYLCGRKGTGNGINNCYMLIDVIFSRKFMTYCSWTGGARNQKEKIPFKVYKNVISLFFKVIHLSDKDFTLKECEEFFKNVIRNSTRRNESNIIRTSAVKKRPKNLNYITKTNMDQHIGNESAITTVQNYEEEKNITARFIEEEEPNTSDKDV